MMLFLLQLLIAGAAAAPYFGYPPMLARPPNHPHRFNNRRIIPSLIVPNEAFEKQTVHVAGNPYLPTAALSGGLHRAHAAQPNNHGRLGTRRHAPTHALRGHHNLGRPHAPIPFQHRFYRGPAFHAPPLLGRAAQLPFPVVGTHQRHHGVYGAQRHPRALARASQQLLQQQQQQQQHRHSSTRHPRHFLRQHKRLYGRSGIAAEEDKVLVELQVSEGDLRNGDVIVAAESVEDAQRQREEEEKTFEPSIAAPEHPLDDSIEEGTSFDGNIMHQALDDQVSFDMDPPKSRAEEEDSPRQPRQYKSNAPNRHRFNSVVRGRPRQYGYRREPYRAAEAPARRPQPAYRPRPTVAAYRPAKKSSWKKSYGYSSKGYGNWEQESDGGGKSSYGYENKGFGEEARPKSFDRYGHGALPAPMSHSDGDASEYQRPHDRPHHETADHYRQERPHYTRPTSHHRRNDDDDGYELHRRNHYDREEHKDDDDDQWSYDDDSLSGRSSGTSRRHSRRQRRKRFQ